LAKRLKILPGVKAAYRQSWHESRDIFLVSWLAVLLSFCLLALPIFFPASRQPCQIADQILLSIIFVGLFRKNLLGEKPALAKIGDIVFYLRFGRREFLYALYAMGLLLIAFLTGQAAEIVAVVPFIGPLVASQVWPLVNFTLACMLILVGPHVATAARPAIGDFPGLIEAVVGNIANVMGAVFFIFLPYMIMTILFSYFPPPNWTADYAEHAVFLICSIVEIKFVGMVYKNLYPAA
jgi:hypothetical protein